MDDLQHHMRSCDKQRICSSRTMEQCEDPRASRTHYLLTEKLAKMEVIVYSCGGLGFLLIWRTRETVHVCRKEEGKLEQNKGGLSKLGSFKIYGAKYCSVGFPLWLLQDSDEACVSYLENEMTSEIIAWKLRNPWAGGGRDRPPHSQVLVVSV